MDSYLGSLLIFGGNFAIRGYAMCNGQLLSISTNQALYAILGTIYGGDGQQTFALPDLRGRTPLHFGTGLGLSGYSLGQKGGSETTTLLTQNMPAHNHLIKVDHKAGNMAQPSQGYLAQAPAGVDIYAGSADTTLNSHSVSLTGGSNPFNNMQPYLCLNYQIAVDGLFPIRN